MTVKVDPSQELDNQVNEIADQRGIPSSQAFVVWFLRAYADANDDECVKALAGASRDKGIDAVYVDDDADIVFVIQGKFRGPNAGTESRAEVISFAHLSDLFLGSKSDFDELVNRADAGQRSLMRKAYQRVQQEHQLQLHFVTTGRISKTHREEAQHIADRGRVTLHCSDRSELNRLVIDYTFGAAPPIPAVDLNVEGERPLKRYDTHVRASSWIFPIQASELARLSDRFGVRLFARNVRGFLGEETPVNRSMRATLLKQPEQFWYFNNGVTMVCDEAEEKTQGNATYIRARNAQIINGLQTTRVIAALKEPTRASVLVKLFAIPRDHNYETFIADVTKATNYQNAISSADLRSNDPVQVDLERELTKRRYLYLRKKQSLREAREHAPPGPKRAKLSKEELAKAVGSCILPPEFWRQGQQRLFEDEQYNRIFVPSRHPSEYLVFYWLYRLIRKSSKGDPRRGYATYLALHFLWGQLGAYLRRASNRDQFVKSAELKRPDLQKSVGALGRTVVDGAMAFRRSTPISKRGTDVSSFFRSVGVDRQFDVYWRSTANRKRRSTFKKSTDKLLSELDPDTQI